VLCLTSLIQEESSCNDEGKTSAEVTSESGSTHSTQIASQDIPQKNTFIHFDLHRESPPTPTSSAPGVLLCRLFKTEAQHEAKRQTGDACTDRPSSVESALSSQVDGSKTSEDRWETESKHDMPLKHTFIHFDLRHERPPTPTASAPGALLSRLFKTKGHMDSKMHVTEIPMEKFTSTDSVVSSLADKSTSDGDFENDSQASTSALDSHVGSPADADSASGVDCDLDVQAKLEELHRSRQCTPCNYFWYKADGCRLASKCEFCHLCPKGEIKKRKKDKLRQMRKAIGAGY